MRSAGSIPETIAGRIRAKILRGGLAPGDRLSEYSISRELHTGQPTVREALFILAQQGLVKRVANTGTFVARLDAQEVRNLLQIRAELEVLAAEMAARNVDMQEADLTELRRHAAAMRAAAPKADKWAYLRADMAFHRKIWELAGNQQLTRILETVVIPLLTCAIQSWRRTSASIEESADAHLVVVDSLRKGPAAARKAMRKHIERFFRAYRDRTLSFGPEDR